MANPTESMTKSMNSDIDFLFKDPPKLDQSDEKKDALKLPSLPTEMDEDGPLQVSIFEGDPSSGDLLKTPQSVKPSDKEKSAFNPMLESATAKNLIRGEASAPRTMISKSPPKVETVNVDDAGSMLQKKLTKMTGENVREPAAAVLESGDFQIKSKVETGELSLKEIKEEDTVNQTYESLTSSGMLAKHSANIARLAQSFGIHLKDGGSVTDQSAKSKLAKAEEVVENDQHLMNLFDKKKFKDRLHMLAAEERKPSAPPEPAASQQLSSLAESSKVGLSSIGPLPTGKALGGVDDTLHNDVFSKIKEKYMRDSMQYSDGSNLLVFSQDQLSQPKKFEDLGVSSMTDVTQSIILNRESRMNFLQQSISQSRAADPKAETSDIRKILNKYTSSEQPGWIDEIEDIQKEASSKPVGSKVPLHENTFEDLELIRKKYQNLLGGETIKEEGPDFSRHTGSQSSALKFELSVGSKADSHKAATMLHSSHSQKKGRHNHSGSAGPSGVEASIDNLLHTLKSTKKGEEFHLTHQGHSPSKNLAHELRGSDHLIGEGLLPLPLPPGQGSKEMYSDHLDLRSDIIEEDPREVSAEVTERKPPGSAVSQSREEIQQFLTEREEHSPPGELNTAAVQSKKEEAPVKVNLIPAEELKSQTTSKKDKKLEKSPVMNEKAEDSLSEKITPENKKLEKTPPSPHQPKLPPSVAQPAAGEEHKTEQSALSEAKAQKPSSEAQLVQEADEQPQLDLKVIPKAETLAPLAPPVQSESRRRSSRSDLQQPSVATTDNVTRGSKKYDASIPYEKREGLSKLTNSFKTREQPKLTSFDYTFKPTTTLSSNEMTSEKKRAQELREQLIAIKSGSKQPPEVLSPSTIQPIAEQMRATALSPVGEGQKGSVDDTIQDIKELVENIAKSPVRFPNPEKTSSPTFKRGRNTDLADRRSPSKTKVVQKQFQQYDTDTIVIRDEHALRPAGGTGPGKDLKLRESIMSGASGGKGLNYNLSSSDDDDKYMQQEPLHTQPNKATQAKKEDFNFDMATIPFSEDPNPDGKRPLPSLQSKDHNHRELSSSVRPDGPLEIEFDSSTEDIESIIRQQQRRARQRAQQPSHGRSEAAPSAQILMTSLTDHDQTSKAGGSKVFPGSSQLPSSSGMEMPRRSMTDQIGKRNKPSPAEAQARGSHLQNDDEESEQSSVYIPRECRKLQEKYGVGLQTSQQVAAAVADMMSPSEQDLLFNLNEINKDLASNQGAKAKTPMVEQEYAPLSKPLSRQEATLSQNSHQKRPSMSDRIQGPAEGLMLNQQSSRMDLSQQAELEIKQLVGEMERISFMDRQILSIVDRIRSGQNRFQVPPEVVSAQVKKVKTILNQIQACQ